MSTIGSLLALMDPGITPYNQQELTANRIQLGTTQNQTQLLALAELRRQHEEAAQARQFMAANPGQMLPGGGAGPLLASPALTAGGGGPMTQQTVVPGQPPGAPQPVPGGQDLSQFAAGGAPPGGMPGGAPQSTLGSLQPQQEPFEARMQALMARSPGAALQVMQTRMKMQEQQLTWGLKSIEAVAQLTQGVKTQEDLDRVRGQMQQIAPQAAAQLPQFYSAEALEAFQEKALGVKERQTLKIQDVQAQANALQAQAASLKAQREQANIPNYTGDAQLDALIYTRMKDQPPGTMPSREIVEAAVQQREADKLKVSREQGLAAAETERTAKPLEGEAAKAVSDLTTLRTMTDDIAALRKDDYTGPVVGRTGYVREQAGRMQPEEVAFRQTVGNIQDLLARMRSGAAIPANEMQRLERLAPSVNDPPEVFKAKLQSFQRELEQTRESRLRTSTTGRSQLREETTPTTPRVGQPGATPTAQGPATFDTADFAQWRRSTGKTGNPTAADVEAYFAAKGLKRR